MSTVIINPKTGLGEPYPEVSISGGFAYTPKLIMGDSLPVITAAGETLREGTWNCEKDCTHIYQGEEICVYRVIETTLDQHIAEIHTLMETLDEKSPMEIAEQKAAEYAKVIWDFEEREKLERDYCESDFIEGWLQGIHNQKEKSIDRDKVIQLINEMDYSGDIGVFIKDLIGQIKQL